MLMLFSLSFFACNYHFFLTTYNLQSEGPNWKVQLGRRDSLTANQTLANQNLPGPSFNLTQLKSAFAAQGLNTTDLVALSGIKKCVQAHVYIFLKEK
jgi:peroxidase